MTLTSRITFLDLLETACANLQTRASHHKQNLCVPDDCLLTDLYSYQNAGRPSWRAVTYVEPDQLTQQDDKSLLENAVHTVGPSHDP